MQAPSSVPQLPQVTPLQICPAPQSLFVLQLPGTQVPFEVWQV
jgi:hypothetical protein